MNTRLSRRSAVRHITAGAAVAAASLGGRLSAADAALGKLKGRVNHSVCKWCYKDVSLEDLCKAGREMGLASVELLQPADFATLKKHGLTCAMVSNPSGKTPQGVTVGGIPKAFNRVEHHDTLVQGYEVQIKACAEAGMTNLICFSGNREGMSDEQGLENCAIGLKRLMSFAEQHKVTLVMELLNSKVNHKDYQCDHTAWGVELCKKVGSERFKLLYDIYHMQIMEGDVIRTIRDNIQHIAHFHTGGVPGRNEIDNTQELNYATITRAIIETGFSGYMAHEFIPKREPLTSLREATILCDV